MSIVLQGSTSGSITLQEPAIAGSTVLNLPATSGTLITTGSSGQVIPRAALPTGSVLQVVNASYATQTSSTSNTYTDTGLIASITPTSATSKILILINNNGNYVQGGSVDAGIRFRLLRGASVLAVTEEVGAYLDSTTAHSGTSSSSCYLDSPNTTSSTTYKTQFHSRNNTSVVFTQFGGSVSTITLMEIAA